MERYLGIDVHRDSSTICVLSATGKRVRMDRVETNGPVLIRYLQGLSGKLHVCIEESTWSEWLYEILSPHVAHLVVYQAKWAPGSKSDAIDAHGLAEKLRIGQAGPGVFKAPNRFRQLREWARVYQILNADTVRTKNRIKSLFRRRGIRCTGTSVYDPGKRTEWLGQLPPTMKPSASVLYSELDSLVELKAQAEAQMLQEARRHKIAKTLQTAPGLGPVRTALMIATVITPHRFRSKRQFWTYCGFGIITRSSSDWEKTPEGWKRVPAMSTRGLNHNHNPLLKSIFKSAALTAISQTKADHPLRAAYARLCDAGTRPHLARLTIARKISAAVLAMWKRQEVYQPGN